MGVGRLKGTDMKVAVTGGSGFIGTHVVDHLVTQGHQVIVLDRAAPTHRADVEFRELDILDLDGLVAGTRGCDVVFHLAAVSNVNIAFDHPVATIEVNVTDVETGGTVSPVQGDAAETRDGDVPVTDDVAASVTVIVC